MALTINTNIINQTEGGHLIDAKNVKGGYFVVDTNPNNITDTNILPKDTKVSGSLCYCTGDKKFYQYNGTKWAEKFSAPILINDSLYDKIDQLAVGVEVEEEIDLTESGYETASEFFINLFNLITKDNCTGFFVQNTSNYAQFYLQVSQVYDFTSSGFGHTITLIIVVRDGSDSNSSILFLDYDDYHHIIYLGYENLKHNTVSQGTNITVTETKGDYKVSLNNEIELTKVNATTVTTDVLETPTVLQDGDTFAVQDTSGNTIAQIDESGLNIVGVKVNGKEVATKEDLLLYRTDDDNGNFILAQSSKSTYLSSERYFKVEHKADGSATHTDLDNIYIKSNSLIASDMEPGTIKVLATKNDALTGENTREWVDPTKELVVMSANTAINATNAERATSATNAATAEWATNATNATNADNAITAETADHAKELQDSWRLCKRYAPGDTDYSFDLPEGVYMFMWKFYSPSLTNNIFTDILALRIGDFGGLSDVQTEPRGTSHQILCGSFDVEERIFANLIASPNSSLRTFTIDVELFDKNGISHTDTTSFIEIYFKPISNINIFGIPTNLTCSTCTGTGKTSIDCTVCNGTNRCSVCDGTGLESCSECGGNHTCPSCGGDGTKTYLEVCGKCHGSAFSYLCNACGMDVSLYQTSTDEAGQMHRSVLGVKDTCPNGHSTAGAVETMCTACSAMGVTGEDITYSCPNCGPTPVTTGTSILPGTGECPYCDITGQITCRNCAGAKTCQGQCTQGKVYSTCTTCGGDGTI